MAAEKRRLCLSGESFNIQQFLKDSLDLSFRSPFPLRCVFYNKLTPSFFGNGFGCHVIDSYFSLLNLSFVENNHICIFTTFAKQSMINRLSNPINRNRSAAKNSKVMSSNIHLLRTCQGDWKMQISSHCQWFCNTEPQIEDLNLLSLSINCGVL